MAAGDLQARCVLELPGMANHLSMANIQAIAARHRSGHSNRHIARVLEINRETVDKDVAQLKRQTAPNSQADSGVETSISDKSVSAALAGPASSCEPHREQILKWIDGGMKRSRRPFAGVASRPSSSPAAATPRKRRRCSPTRSSRWKARLHRTAEDKDDQQQTHGSVTFPMMVPKLRKRLADESRLRSSRRF